MKKYGFPVILTGFPVKFFKKVPFSSQFDWTGNFRVYIRVVIMSEQINYFGNIDNLGVSSQFDWILTGMTIGSSQIHWEMTGFQ